MRLVYHYAGRFRLYIGLLCCALFALSFSKAATFTWDAGGTDDNWSTDDNWVGGVAPPINDSSTQFVFPTGTISSNDQVGFVLEKITFDALLGGGSFDIDGSSIAFAGTHDIDIDHSGFASISNDLTITTNLQIRGNNGGTLTISGDIDGSSGGFMTKFEDHTLILSGNNTFSNRIRIRGGILESQSANGLGGANRVDFEDDQLGGQTPTLFISTVNQTFAGTLRAENNDNGYIDVDSGITFTVNGSGNALQWDSAGSAFFKQGEGTLILDKSSSGSGLLTIEDGIVRISDSGALGATASGVVVESGGSLELTEGITVTGEPITIDGTGQGGVGALANQSGNNTWDGDITLSGDSTIASNDAASTLTLSSGNTLNNAGNDLTLNGTGDIIAATDITGGGALIKSGSGTTTVSGTNTYTGTTTVQDGILQVESATGLGGTGSGTTVDSGATLGLSGGITVSNETLTLAGTGDGGVGALANQSGNNTWDGDITLSGDSTIASNDAASTLTLSSGNTLNNAGNDLTLNGTGDIIAATDITGGGALIKSGSGTTTVSGTNTYTGTTTVQDGILQVESATGLGGTGSGTTVDSGATLGLSGGITVSNETLTLAGTGDGGVGALANQSGNNAWDGDVILSGDSTIANNAGGSTLTVGTAAANQTVTNNGFDVTIAGAGDILFNAQFSGSGGLIKNGAGTTTLSFGSNTTLSVYSGTTTVNEGTLIADLGDGTLTPLTGDITVGDGTGTDTLQTRWVDNIGDSANVRVNSSGVFEVGGFYDNTITETIGSLTLEGGALVQSVDPATNVSTIQLNGDVTRVASGNTTATIAGNLSLGAATRTFDVADSTASDDLEISATLSNGGLDKTGAGNLVLSGTTDNTHSTTVVDAGTLTLNKTAGTDAVSGSVTVNGGTLLLDASNQFEDSTTLELAGGDLETQGNSEVLGTLTLNGNSNIDLGNSGIVNFADSSGESWSGALTITNWNGSQYGGGATQIFFGNSNAGLNAGQISQITFVNPWGFAGNFDGYLTSTGELVVAIPEPSTYLTGGLLLLSAITWHIRRKRIPM